MLGRIAWMSIALAVVPAACLGQATTGRNRAASNSWGFQDRLPVGQQRQPLSNSQVPHRQDSPPAPAPAGQAVPAGYSTAASAGAAVPAVWNQAPPPGNVASQSSGGKPSKPSHGAGTAQTIPLRPPKSAGQSARAARPSANATPSVVTVGSSLAMVLGLFLLVAWLMRRNTPGALSVLPSEVFEVLGRSTLGGQQQVQLVRCGNRVLLLSVGPSGPETLCEISDPDEVTQVVALCRQGRPDSAATTFRQMIDQFGASGAPGHVGNRS